MTAREIWNGASLSVDFTGGDTYVLQPRIRSLAGGSRSRQRVNTTALEDTYECVTLGIESANEITIEQFVKKDDAQQKLWNTALQQNDEIGVKITYADGTNEEMLCRVAEINSNAGDVTAPVVRTIVLLRTSGITHNDS